MADYVKHLSVSGLHGRMNLSLNFRDGINVLYGRNGSGKTTMLHILANVLNGSLNRFAYLNFSEVRLTTATNQTVRIERELDVSSEGDDISVYLNNEHVLGFNAAQYRNRRSSAPAAPRASRVRLDREREMDRSTEITDLLPLGTAAYFPAFRTIIEAWWSVQAEEPRTRLTWTDSDESSSSFAEYLRLGLYEQEDRKTRLTVLARNLFGDFVPQIQYPSAPEIEIALRQRVQAAISRVRSQGESILSEAFLDAFDALSPGDGQTSNTPDQTLSAIRLLLEELEGTELVKDEVPRKDDVYRRLRDRAESLRSKDLSHTASNVLAVYRRSLSQRIDEQRKTYAPIQKYIESVNQFLEDKSLVITFPQPQTSLPHVLIKFGDNSMEHLKSLSSGERQIVSMLYAASNIGTDSVVLIDESEISLHIDWQRMLLSKMGGQLGERQIVVCTHSPEIGADYEDRYQEVRPVLAF